MLYPASLSYEPHVAEFKMRQLTPLVLLVLMQDFSKWRWEQPHWNFFIIFQAVQGDITGTLVTANKDVNSQTLADRKLAVFSGHKQINVGGELSR